MLQTTTKEKGREEKNIEMTKTNYDQKEAEVAYYEWRCFYSVIFKVLDLGLYPSQDTKSPEPRIRSRVQGYWQILSSS